MQGLDTDAMHGLLKQKGGTVAPASALDIVVVIAVAVVMFAAEPLEGGGGQAVYDI